MTDFVYFGEGEVGVDFSKVLYYEFDKDDVGGFVRVYFENGSTPLKIRDVTPEKLMNRLDRL